MITTPDESTEVGAVPSAPSEKALRAVDDLELATLGWVHWFNEHRLHSSIGHVLPVEYRQAYYGQINSSEQSLAGELALH